MNKRAQFAAAQYSGEVNTKICEGGTLGTLPFSVAWSPDETLSPYFKEMASSQGITPEQAVSQIFNYGLANGWAFSVPDVTTVFLTKSAARIVQEFIGGGGNETVINGELLAQKLMEAMADKSAKQESAKLGPVALK